MELAEQCGCVRNVLLTRLMRDECVYLCAHLLLLVRFCSISYSSYIVTVAILIGIIF